MVGAQTSKTDSISLDLLTSAGNPAFNMLGLAESDIHRPTDLAKLAVSIRTATKDLTIIPKSLGLEIAPFLLGRTKYTLEDYDKSENTFKQTFAISFGFTNLNLNGSDDFDSLNTQKMGFGLKFSLVRPHWSDKTRSLYTDLITAQRNALKFFETKMRNEALEKLRTKLVQEQDSIAEDTTLTDDEQTKLMTIYDDSISIIDEKINTEKNDEFKLTGTYKSIRNTILKFKNEREGPFLDFVSGIAIDFPSNKFNYSIVHKAGAWLTGGYDNGNKGISSMFVLRYLFSPDYEIIDKIGIIRSINAHSFDFGARFAIKTFEDRFSFSSEYLYRSFIKSTVSIPATWRLVFNAEYDLGKNKKITFAFGKNFDGTTSKSGNLISILNFITGLGTGRRI